MPASHEARGALLLHQAIERLATLIANTDTVALDPGMVRIEYDAHLATFAAFASQDAELPDGVLVELSSGLVERVVHAAEAAASTTPGAPSAVILAELALQWIVLHEMGHWALGHIGYVAEGACLTSGTWRLTAVDHEVNSLTPVSNQGHIEPADYRCLELQADFFATEVLDTIHQSGSVESCLAAKGNVAVDAAEERQRAVGIAAGLCILLMERVRQDAKISTGLRHPTPEARAFNVMQVIIGHAVAEEGFLRDGQIILRMTDDQHLDRIRSKLAGVLRIFGGDLAHVASALAVAPLFAQGDVASLEFAGAPDERVSVTMSDLLRHVLKPQSPPDDFITAGVREFAELRRRFSGLHSRLERFSYWRDGEA